MFEITESKLKHYEGIARSTANQSHDEHTKVGALLIHGKTGAIISSGFNGYIRKAADNKLPKTRPEKYEFMIHAETNLIYNCAKHGVSTDECFVFCTLSPCINCVRAMYQSGITKVYFKDVHSSFEQSTSALDLHLLLKEIGDYHCAEFFPRNI